MTIPPGPLASLASFRRAGEEAAAAVAAGHPCVVLLGEAAETDALLGVATAALARARETLHAVPPDRFTETDLVRPGEGGVLVVAGADRLAFRDLRLLDAHLKREPRAAPRARLLLAGNPLLRELTAFPDFAALHRASFLVAPPRLQAAEQAALLAVAAPSLGATDRAAFTHLAGGDAAVLLDLLRYPRLRRALLRLAASRLVARPLAHPLWLAGLACLALALTVAVPAIFGHIGAPVRAAPPPAAEAQRASAPAPAATPGADIASVETADPGAAPPDDGVTVDHESPEQAAAENLAHMARLVPALPGETLAAMYTRVYRGVRTPPSFGAVEAVNPFAPTAGARLVFPAPRAGWPRA